MKTESIPDVVLDQLEVGLSAIWWKPEDPTKSEWVFINETRCTMAGYTRKELLAIPPLVTATRETIAQIEASNEHIRKFGRFTCESTLRHRSQKVVPVRLHMNITNFRGREILLIEYHNIDAYKRTEEKLRRARESARDMLALIEKEKRQLAENIVGNLGLVAFPLIDQLRIGASGPQREVLDLLETRLRHVSRELGFGDRSDALEANLSRREILIGEMIRDGMTSKEIAGALGCAPSTINNHRNTIRRKLGLSGKSVNLQTWLNRERRSGGAGP